MDPFVLNSDQSFNETEAFDNAVCAEEMAFALFKVSHTLFQNCLELYPMLWALNRYGRLLFFDKFFLKSFKQSNIPVLFE